MKTIKELADDLGVSKTAVMKKDPAQNHPQAILT